jgi:hypothetical protein
MQPIRKIKWFQLVQKIYTHTDIYIAVGTLCRPHRLWLVWINFLYVVHCLCHLCVRACSGTCACVCVCAHACAHVCLCVCVYSRLENVFFTGPMHVHSLTLLENFLILLSLTSQQCLIKHICDTGIANYEKKFSLNLQSWVTNLWKISMTIPSVSMKVFDKIFSVNWVVILRYS